MSQPLVDNLVECSMCHKMFWVPQPEPMYEVGYDVIWRAPNHADGASQCIGSGLQGIPRDTRVHEPS